jgi:transglutaminase-like putative cysteine protease
MNKILFLLFSVLTLGGFSQPSLDLSSALKRYPGQPGYMEERSMEVEIKLYKSEGPRFYLSQKDILFTLTDNNTSFAVGKEYYGYSYNLKKIEAFTLVPQPQEYVKVMVKDYKKTSEIGDGLFYDDRVALNYTYPSVCKGAKLVQETEYEVDKTYSAVVFYFGTGIPIEKAYLKLTFPENINIRYKIFGGDSTLVKLTKEKKGKKWIYSWVALDIPSYLPENDAPSSRYFIPHIYVAVTGYTKGNEYKPVFRNIKDLYDWNFDKIKNINSDNSKDIQSIADSITHGVADELDKVKKIYRWVQKNIRYVAIEDGLNGFIPRPAALVLHRRYGDCKDKSSLLKALMTSQGIDASMVWVGTRDLPYKYTDFPSVMVDNHMIAAYWDKTGKPHLLDGTSHNHPIDVTPSFIQGKQCLIDRGPDKYVLYDIPVSSPEENTIIDSVFMHLSNDTLTGNGQAYFTGEPKVDMIDRFDGADAKRFKNIVMAVLPKGSNKLNVDSVRLSDINKVDDTLRVGYKFNLPNYISFRNNNIYVNLNLDKTLQDINIKPERIQPIEREYTVLKKIVCVFQIPEGYEIQKVPEETKYQNDKYSFTLKYQLIGSKIVLSKNIRINVLLLCKEDFPSFTEMIGILNKSYIQTLVLRKK